MQRKEEIVKYDGRYVPKNGFRTFVYSLNEQKLVNSWEEYEEHMLSGIWFSDKKSAEEFGKNKPKKKEG